MITHMFIITSPKPVCPLVAVRRAGVPMYSVISVHVCHFTLEVVFPKSILINSVSCILSALSPLFTLK